ncbi:3-phenylpropionate/trans-cinnamate dioxygenase ferredoxin reductase subunit [Rhizomicrobium palustre]|uniref:3-phenylpropionate/trans-cinnamate dioxygenase ferredoxin reductase subunit n=1 Tax=Rhizomicrobium palustre TaxID=189966 RepID=A0A846N430_9PROT|nr:FAD-dependent oxidoreductase [Rhizomicrobium palustre]NIK90486.1 3-phenylpropionate/trans-cinnamate dioxygenase ferredoxin reductase subunit [Rhizomicrobium palustre]
MLNENIPPIIIIGAGQAGAQAVISLRAEGFLGPITMIGDEAYAPYQRPPLSKAYLMGKFERARLFLKSDSFYEEAGCNLILNASATAIDRAAKTVTLSDGRVLPYGQILIATGTRIRPIPCPGAELGGLFYLRSIADVDALQTAFHPGKKLVVIGGGFIGLEVAAVAAKHGLDVTVFEAMERVMARAVSKQVSDFFEGAHRAAGVKLITSTGVEGFEGEGSVSGVRAGGQLYPADLVLIGIGVLPNMEIARDAGIECKNGIVVDKFCATNDPAIFAAGDCTWHENRDGDWMRLESVQNAIDQAKHAALAMVGKPKAYNEVPWFWSDQYDLKLQIAGLTKPGDEVVLRGDPAARKFSVFHLRDGILAAVESVNQPAEYLMGRKLIGEGVKVDVARLADTSIAIKNVVA